MLATSAAAAEVFCLSAANKGWARSRAPTTTGRSSALPTTHLMATSAPVAYLFLPAKGKAPYETVLYFPGSNALNLRKFNLYPTGTFDAVLRSGRAVIFGFFKLKICCTGNRGIPQLLVHGDVDGLAFFPPRRPPTASTFRRGIHAPSAALDQHSRLLPALRDSRRLPQESGDFVPFFQMRRVRLGARLRL
jgi:hypothetical protein